MEPEMRWLVFDEEDGVVGLVESSQKPDAMLLARKRYGRMAERVQSLADAEIAAQERAARRRRQQPA